MSDGQNCSGNVAALVEALLHSPKLGRQISTHQVFPAAPAEHAEPKLPWPRPINDLLQKRGLRLFSHQALAVNHIRAGRAVVAATPTASGKSLIYNLPVLEQHLRDPEATALYLFPLKALSQDQLSSFRALCSDWAGAARPTAEIYDGDTSDYKRRKIRSEPPTALITTPEMLHCGIIPYHRSWTTFLANLSHIIVDEAHTYRGVFGSHMAQLFRRLNRILANYGAEPTYIFCTATLGNPEELATRLLGRPESVPPALIDQSGAPQGKRHFLFINPEQAASTCAIDLLKRCLDHGLRSIVYCQSRRMAELISKWASDESGPFRERISCYRAGYLPEERREIEARMATGRLMAVVSTSALELGIDIGGLDVCILVGYPGTITQTLQRGGRVGRAGQESAVLLVAGEDAMDQYFARHPEDFFSRKPENAAVNPDNELILSQHLECAAAELPLAVSDPWLNQESAQKALLALARQGRLLQSADGSQWLATRKFPQRNLNLRGGGLSWILEDNSGNIIGAIDGFRAWKETHPGAIYLHRGQTYLVSELDAGRMRILLEPANAGWYTNVRSRKSTEILEEFERHAIGNCAVFRGRLRITEQITGFERRSTIGQKLLNITPLAAPPQVFETDGIWFVIPDQLRRQAEDAGIHFMGAIHALEHAMIGMLPLQVMADRNDFGGISIPLHPQLGLPAVFIYDGLPGGAGLCHSAYTGATSLLESTLKAVSDCPCETGCPSCIHSPKCGAGNRPLSKSGAIHLLTESLRTGPLGAEICGTLPELKGSQFEHVPAMPVVQHAPALQGTAPEPAAVISRARPPANYVVFDVETRLSAAEVGGWNRADAMGVSVAVLYDSVRDECQAFEQEEIGAMLRRMAEADLIVGFNSFRFDYKTLEPFAARLGLDLHALPGLDLLRKVTETLGYRVSLDNLCQATLNAKKSSDGLQALRWWKEGRITEIAAYCRKDVELTRNLYLFGLAEKYLLFTNKAGARVRVPVDFSQNRGEACASPSVNLRSDKPEPI